MASPVAALSESRWVHRAIGATRIYDATAWALARWPVERKFGTSRYRITSLDQLAIASEIFMKEIYGPVLDFGEIDSLIDAGCNAGWFAVWLAERSRKSERKSLLVDANARLVTEARWHVEKNRLGGHHVVHGAAGLPPGVARANFHVFPSASQSSLVDYNAEKQLPLKGKIHDVEVPAISLGAQWNALFDGARVDLAKIDIEGSELDLVEHEGDFLRDCVHALVVEWHKWRVQDADLDAALARLGFGRTGTSAETDMSGLALYVNRAV